ncbi:MAG: asparagine synthetase B [Planctomycetota bacterium]
MAGIAGIVGGKPDSATLRAMLRTLRHRGRDAEGFYDGKDAALAVCQHSATGADDDTPPTDARVSKARAGGPRGGLGQPFSDGPQNIRVALDGHLTNAAALRAELISGGAKFQTSSAPEVLLEAWRRYGTGCFARLCGAFACAIWDQRLGTMILARDPFGITPMFTWLHGDSLRFASEIKALLALDGFPRELDAFAVEDFFTWGYIPPPRTIWRAVRAVPPGHYALFREGRLTLHRYFALHWPGAPEERTREDWLMQFAGSFEQAVGRVLFSAPGSTGASAALEHNLEHAALGVRANTESLLLATHAARLAGANGLRALAPDGVPDPFDRGPIDAARLRAATRELKLPTEPLGYSLFDAATSKAPAGGGDQLAALAAELVAHLDQPIADPMLLSQLAEWRHIAASGVRTLIDSLGADEVFGGYRRVFALVRSERIDWTPPLLRDIGAMLSRWLPGLDRGRLARYMTGGPGGLPGKALVRGSVLSLSRGAVSVWREFRRFIGGAVLQPRERYLHWLRIGLPARSIFTDGFRALCERHDPSREYRVAFDRLGPRRTARGIDENGHAGAHTNGHAEPLIAWHELAGEPARWPGDHETPGVISGAVECGPGAGPADGRPLADRAIALDLATWLPGSVLPGADACAALAGLELRLPYLDHELVEWSTQLPAALKVGPQGGKRLLALAAREATPAAAGLDGGSPDRRRMAEWLLESPHLGTTIGAVLDSPAMAERGIVDVAAVQKLRKQYDSGRGDTAALQLFALWMFEAWCQAH